ncbi:phosphoribosylaminoimidazolesuccinocarboxamide synthase [Succinispira mobilis]|uniref:phosphoribosylaminoimidazolesuccinocarboxamide synthase n=1 Tax=Succinispira mobilis TaxID=78120 RepID=UPI000368D1FC|nr:phosphoribosylaminoimidazolesuccinocarboxamide synthase [Succinispira mobilis]
MKMGEMLYEGKAKKIFKTDKENEVIVYYKDDATAFNGLKKGTIINKGIMNNKITNFFFDLLGKQGIPHHIIKELSDREVLVKKVQIIPIEVVTRNIVAGSLSKNLGIPEGEKLASTVVELYYKNDEVGDPPINYYHAKAMKLATQEQIDTMEKYALKINEILSAYLAERGILLVDFKLEFGLYEGQVILADEITPDTCRLWDSKTMEKMDKDRFRRDLGNVEEAYQEVLKRLIG